MSERFRTFLPFIFGPPKSEESQPAGLQGKGVWARPRGSSAWELDRAIQIATQIGGTHVLYKVANGSTYYNNSAQAAQRIRDAGLVPYGWIWLLLDDPAGEAAAIARAFEDGYKGLVLNVEVLCSRKFDQARTLASAVQQARLDLNAIFNCSFPNITHHRDLPYDELNVICKGGLMPMVYGSFFAPTDPTPWEAQARRVVDEWAYGHYEYWCERWGYRPPLHPVLGPYHDEYGSVRMSPAEFQLWLARLEAHAPSFISLFTAAVIDNALLPLVRDFPLAGGGVELPVPPTAWVHPLAGVVLHQSPDPGSVRQYAVAYGAALEGLARRTGSDGERWLQVRTPDGSTGWAREDRFTLTNPGPPPQAPVPPPPPPGQLTHVWTEQEVNYRSQPAVRPDTLIGRIYAGAQLRVLENPAVARMKLGVIGQWLNVQLQPDGPEGWVAAWYVTDHAPGHVEHPPVSHVRVESGIGLSVRAAPAADAKKLWHVPDGTILDILEDPRQAAAKIGVQDKWVQVRTPSLHEGYVAAWHLSADVPPDDRRPAVDAVLPFGTSAWIFGIHGVGVNETRDFRHLFQGSGKTGWMLFTEAIGCNPTSLGPDPVRRQKLWNLAQGSGYGIVLRLNNGYGSSGTLPPSSQYDAFARTCARYAELYLKRPEVSANLYNWVIIIGNEQNNVREHPGGADDPQEHITPQLYAQAFNLAYQRIKAVLPNCIVVPGAVDPYNTYPWVKLGGMRMRPLDYFRQMLDGIDALDGFALHTYTHGPVVSYITHKRVFTDPPLDPGTEYEHYYDFQAYRSFMEAIPKKWRNLPVYITETNHWVVNPDGTPPLGWVNQNIGWVREAYAEIHRWNSTPYAQQIHCLLLYRWQDDEWQIETKDQVQADFKMALQNDYRWRK